MKIGILAAGITPDNLLPSFGSYAGMFVDHFKQREPSFEFKIFDVRDGIFPSSAEQCDAWLITGSRSNVEERTPWMLQLNELIVQIDTNKKPLVGICFGHQIIADVLGGEVAQFNGGWGIGVHQYDIESSAVLPVNLSTMSICAMHQYQVVTKPERATVFAASAFCKYAGLIYDKHIFTLQGHPEFSKAYEEVLIKTLGESGSFSEELAEQGLLSVEQEKIDSSEVMDWIVHFIKLAN